MTAAAERIDFRLPETEKSLLARAAEQRGVGVSAFVRNAAVEAAKQVLQDVEDIRLSEEASRRLVEALDQPWTPNERLAQAMARAAHVPVR